MKKYKQVVIGSNSYLGINLCMLLDKDNTLLVSRSMVDKDLDSWDFVQCDFTTGTLPPIDCRIVYVLARPITESETELERFYSGLDLAISDMLNINPELVIHFISTSLVFSSEDPGELTVNSPLDLRRPYEKYKYEMEQRLKLRATKFSSAYLNVHRIPLLVGGVMRTRDKEQQLFYKMYTGFKEGLRWHFSDSAPAYGTSFLYVTDFVQWLVSGIFATGYHVFLPASGNISYKQLQQEFSERCLPLPIKTTQSCPASFLVIKNNTPIVQRKFSALFNP